MSVEESAFDKGDVEKVLQRYDQKKTYFIRSECRVWLKGSPWICRLSGWRGGEGVVVDLAVDKDLAKCQ